MSNQQRQAQAQGLPALAKQQVATVEQRIKELEQAGQIEFPPAYSVSNALRSAYLELQRVKDKQGNPALNVCTQASVTNALLDMAVMGLNLTKKQAYFIVYGNQLVCMRSYHGTRAVAMRVDETISDIVAEVVWDGDEFEYEIDRGKKRIIKHKQTLKSIDTKKPQGAYCLILDHDGEVKRTEIMTFEQIKLAWKKSPVNPVQDSGQIKPGSTHSDFMEEMIKRTVINRACKPIINSSSDAYLYRAAVRSEHLQTEEEAKAEVEEHANQEVIDVDVEVEPEQKQEPKPEKPKGKSKGKKQEPEPEPEVPEDIDIHKEEPAEYGQEYDKHGPEDEDLQPGF